MSQLSESIICLAGAVLASRIPVLVLLHEDFVFARLHLGVVLDGAARLDEELVDAPAEFQNCVRNRLCCNPSQLETPHVMRERPRRVPVFQDTTKEFRFAIEGREVDIPPIKDTLQGGPSGREPALG